MYGRGDDGGSVPNQLRTVRVRKSDAELRVTSKCTTAATIFRVEMQGLVGVCIDGQGRPDHHPSVLSHLRDDRVLNCWGRESSRDKQ